jgi:hypothetical protein
LPRAR